VPSLPMTVSLAVSLFVELAVQESVFEGPVVEDEDPGVMRERLLCVRGDCLKVEPVRNLGAEGFGRRELEESRGKEVEEVEGAEVEVAVEVVYEVEEGFGFR